jgi:putative aldouronate transport system permease protein
MVIPGAIASFNVIIMRTFFEGIPEALEESARIDGASHMQILIRIILPLSVPSIATVCLFYAVGHWNSFFGALLYLRDQKMQPIQIVLRNIVIMNQTDSVMQSISDDRAQISESIKYATIMVATLPILIVYPFIQKYFVQGVMIGSVKG